MAKKDQADEAQTPILNPHTTTATEPPKGQRVFSRQVKKIHDLYKLMVANMRKNVALEGSNPEFQTVEHCHFFHTFTSDGQAQNTSSTIGGHFHVMEVVTPATDTTPAVYKCSPPMRWGVVKDKYKRKVREMVPANLDDDHTHDVQYIKSDELVLRTKNTEAVKLHAEVGAKYDKTLPGVAG